MAKILIIDDEETVRFSLREVLTDEGHVVDEAADGEEGLAKIAAGVFDLAIVDLIMPRKGGIEAIAEIAGHRPGMPVLAVSGGSRARGIDLFARAKAAGAAAILRKPFSCGELLETVDSLLRRGPR